MYKLEPMRKLEESRVENLATEACRIKVNPSASKTSLIAVGVSTPKGDEYAR